MKAARTPSPRRDARPKRPKRYTLMLVPDGGTIRQVELTEAQLRRWAMTGAAALALLLALLAAAASTLGGDPRLASENRLLKTRLAEIERSVEQLEGELGELQQTAAELEDLRGSMGPLSAEEMARLRAAKERPRAASALAAWTLEQAERLRGLAGLLRPRLERQRDVAALRRQALPTAWPLPGAILTSGLGMRISPIDGEWRFHKGLDLSAPIGTPIQAAGAGVVLRAGWYGGYGNLVEIDHGAGVSTRYAHSSQLLVEAGQQVYTGDVIATVGSTGSSTGPHLHYEIRLDGEPLDPLDYAAAAVAPGDLAEPSLVPAPRSP